MLWAYTLLSGQQGRFSATAEYSMNWSKISNELADAQYKISHNGFLKANYDLSSHIALSAGIGILNTGEQYNEEVVGSPELERILYIDNYNYLVFPVGSIFRLGSFYVHPEIGFGLNLSNRTKVRTTYEDGTTDTELFDSALIFGDYNKFTAPVLLTIGHEFPVSSFTLVAGFRGYYSITQVYRDVSRNGHYFGFGLYMGFRI